MGYRQRSMLMALLVLATMPALSAGIPASPLEVYGRLPAIEDLAISPDGTLLAFVRTKGEKRTVVIASLKQGAGVNTIQMGDYKLRSLLWADDGHLLMFTSQSGAFYGAADSVWLDKSEWSRLTVFDVARGTLKTLPSTTNNRGQNVFGVISGLVMVRRIDGHTVVFVPSLYAQSGEFGAILYRIDLATGEQTVARESSGATDGWLVDASGSLVAERKYFDSGKRWTLSVRRGEELAEVLSGHEIDVPNVIGFWNDERTLLTQSVAEGDVVWRLLSLEDGKLGPPIIDGTMLAEAIEDERTNHVLGSRSQDDVASVQFLDAGQQRHWSTLAHAFVGERVQLVSWSADFNQLVVRVEGAKDGYRYELVDLRNSRAQALGDVYEGIGQPLEVRSLTYPAADGLQISAYLTLPRGRDPKHLPLVVLVHGGPAASDTADFDWWSQALGAQGYAVLRANFRGSDRGWKFLSAGFGEWGRKMQGDLSDGVRFLAEEGIIDASRVCIMGGSYGGYAALAGVSLEPDVYRCAVSVAGISDLRRLLQMTQFRGNDTATTRYWKRFIGVTGPDDPLLDRISPIRHVAAVKAPVLLVHGVDDTVVPMVQSRLMFEALEGSHNQVQLVTLKHEDHWLSRSDTRLQMLQAATAFLRANNPPE